MTPMHQGRYDGPRESGSGLRRPRFRLPSSIRLEMPASDHNPVFIVGCPRSGTTLLQAMLSSHSRIIIPPEDDFILRLRTASRGYDDRSLGANEIADLLDDLYAPHQYFANWDLPRSRLEATLADRQSVTLMQFVQCVHESYLQVYPGKTRWGCKVPYFALHLQELASLFPRARFLHVVRDGRDTFVSMKDRIRRGATHFPRTATRAAWVWKKVVRSAARQGDQLGDNYALVRYEDLVTDAASTLQRVCEFLGEPYCPEMVSHYYEDLQQHHRPRMYQMNEYVKQRVDASNTERWRHSLSADELYQYESIAGDTLLQFGYPRSSATLKVSVPTRIETACRRAAYAAWDCMPVSLKRARYHT